MRRYFGSLVIVIALTAVVTAAGAQKQPETFTFLDITDTHQTAADSAQPLRQLAEDAANMTPRPAFIVDTGNVTETGRQEEYARFKEAISSLESARIGFYPVPGNHDVRWSPDGKEGFSQAFGKLYQSFDYGGAHFVLLDSTVALEPWGHFDKAQLDWLDRDLKKLKAETPVFLFMHHPIGRDVPAPRFIDNEFEMLRKLRGHNVMTLFTGHGHSDLMWKTNGITTLMARGLYQGSYYKVTVNPLLVTIDRIYTKDPGPPFHITLPIPRKAKSSQLRAGWDDPDVPFLERKRPALTLEPRAVTDNPDKEKAEYRVDEGPFKAMTKDNRDIWRDVFMTKPLPVGIHSSIVRLTTSSGVTFSDELIFEVERSNSEATRKWALDLDGPIQSSPLLANDLLYVSSLDKNIYALTLDKGKKRWIFPTKGAILASPVVENGLLYIGSNDHLFYAVDALTGKPRWHFDTGSPIFGTAAVAKGVVCVGGNGHIYGLDAVSGTPRWTQPAGGFFQSRAVTDGDTFYLGGWDNKFYALDAQTGTLRWTKTLGRNFYFSPAIASPAVANGMVYICSNDGVLHAYNAQNGNEQWMVSAPKASDVLGCSSPIVYGDTLYIAGLGNKGEVYAFNAANGAPRWHVSTGQTFYDSSVKVAPDGKSLAIMGLRGKVSILDTENGKRLWGYELGPGNIFSAPEYDGSIVYTVTMANDVQAINGPGIGEIPRRKPAAEDKPVKTH